MCSFTRPQLEEAWLDDEHSEFLEQLKMEMLEEQQREEMELAALQEEQENEQVRQQQHICSERLCNCFLFPVCRRNKNHKATESKSKRLKSTFALTDRP